MLIALANPNGMPQPVQIPDLCRAITSNLPLVVFTALFLSPLVSYPILNLAFLVHVLIPDSPILIFLKMIACLWSRRYRLHHTADVGIQQCSQTK